MSILAFGVMLSACGGSTPLAPTPPAPTRVTVNVFNVGPLNNCAGEDCRFGGTVSNPTTGCLSHIQGQTSGANFVGVKLIEWSLEGTLRPWQAQTFEACCFPAVTFRYTPIPSFSTAFGQAVACP